MTVDYSGKATAPEQLPCWRDEWLAKREAAQKKGDFSDNDVPIDEAEVFISIVVPAYNEEKRLSGMLEEAVEYLQREYGVADGVEDPMEQVNGSALAKPADGKT